MKYENIRETIVNYCAVTLLAGCSQNKTDNSKATKSTNERTSQVTTAQKETQTKITVSINGT
ncbi:hypothetical protein [Companilactobacillus alimentarius]|uniref:hypothetical protein n=1 Tax=Companilactobacillus alimentarius TaxID=1602 RepID=UPI0028B2A057|nr:hypothetical protein [Companilactobacillus alimentarius]MDT6952743.1 hypothetical protein [Companilactobacillus alimentarius]